MSYNSQEIEKMLKTMQLVTQGMDIGKLASLYQLEPDAPENENHPVKLEHIDFIRKHISGGKLKISEENAEALLEQDPTCFQRIAVEFIDYNDKDYFDDGEELDG